jgi:hypothetical protein
VGAEYEPPIIQLVSTPLVKVSVPIAAFASSNVTPNQLKNRSSVGRPMMGLPTRPLPPAGVNESSNVK